MASTPSPAAQRVPGVRAESGPRTAPSSGHAPVRGTAHRVDRGARAGRRRRCPSRCARSPTRTGRAKATSPASARRFTRNSVSESRQMSAISSRTAGTPSRHPIGIGHVQETAIVQDGQHDEQQPERRVRSPAGPGTDCCSIRQPIPSAMPAPSRSGATRPRISWTPSRPSARCHSAAARRCCRVPEWRTPAIPARCRPGAARWPMPVRRSAAVRS